MTTLLNKHLVQPPEVAPYTFGLLSVADVREGGGRWELGGVEYDTDACAHGGYVVGPCAARPGDHDKQFPEGLLTVSGSSPCGVYVRAECNSVGFHEAARIASRRIAMVENREVERFFSREVLGRADADYPLGDRPVPLKYAVGALEAHATQHYGGEPVFHVPRWAFPHFPAQPTKDTGPVQRTAMQSLCAFGTGYLDNPYDPPAYAGLELPPGRAGQFWLFATGAVSVWRAEIQVYEALEERSNTRLALAERPYAVAHDCFVGAVLVDMTEETGR